MGFLCYSMAWALALASYLAQLWFRAQQERHKWRLGHGAQWLWHR